MAQIGISISDDALGELKDSNLNINVSPSDYLDEQYTLNYINNVFKNLDDVTKKIKENVYEAREYIETTIEIPNGIILPEFNINIGDLISEEIIMDSYNMYDYKTGIVNTLSGNLNIRSEPSKNSIKLGSLAKDTQIFILEEDSNNSGWLKIRTSDGQEGYVSSQYIKELDNSTLSNEHVVNITSGSLNLRSGAGTSHDVIGSLVKDETVTVLEGDINKSDWVKIRTSDGQEGYVYSDYIKKS